MFQHILLATDGSPHADRAAERALYLAKTLPDCRVTMIHVTSKMPPRHKLLQANFDVLSLLEEDAHEAIAQTERKFQEEGVSYQLEVAWGEPGVEILNQADSSNVDVIIIGSRGLGRITEVLMGSVSQYVLHHAKCPVMVVK